MKIPQKFTLTRGTKKSNRKTYHFVLIKKYPHFYTYKCIENGIIESFQPGFFLIRESVVKGEKL